MPVWPLLLAMGLNGATASVGDPESLAALRARSVEAYRVSVVDSYGGGYPTVTFSRRADGYAMELWPGERHAVGAEVSPVRVAISRATWEAVQAIPEATPARAAQRVDRLAKAARPGQILEICLHARQGRIESTRWRGSDKPLETGECAGPVTEAADTLYRMAAGADAGCAVLPRTAFRVGEHLDRCLRLAGDRVLAAQVGALAWSKPFTEGRNEDWENRDSATAADYRSFLTPTAVVSTEAEPALVATDPAERLAAMGLGASARVIYDRITASGEQAEVAGRLEIEGAPAQSLTLSQTWRLTLDGWRLQSFVARKR